MAQGLGVERTEIKTQFHRVEHHQTHVAAGFLLSPFDEAAVLSVDGMGDFTSTLSAHARGNNWQELDRVWFPHSIGFLYTTLTMYLGFPYYGDEYKVMGLAPYGHSCGETRNYSSGDARGWQRTLADGVEENESIVSRADQSLL